MRIPRVFPAALLLLSAPLVGACGSLDEEGPPPSTEASEVPPPAPPPADTSATAAAPADGSGMYASQEYALGEDPDSYADNDPSALTDFRPVLAPYGTWADDSTYGTVWTPSPSVVGADFTPYVTAGHWAYDDDYTWVSDYDWGWAPYHYGRWVYIDGRGWSWVPGRVYSGAWVGWGVDDGWGYVGWYPLAPPFFWFGGVAVGYGFAIGPRWSYCPHGEIFSPALGSRIVAGPSVASVGARVHAIGGVNGALARGPAPSRLGFSAAQIPHASGTAGLARAQGFSRPSTAMALGGHAATHASSAASFGSFSRPSAFGGAGMHPGMPTTVQPGSRKKPPEVGGVAPRSGYRGGFRGGFHGGGFHGGGGGGGHGGHR